MIAAVYICLSPCSGHSCKLHSLKCLIWHQVSQYLSLPSLGWMMAGAVNQLSTLKRHSQIWQWTGSLYNRRIPSMIEGFPGKVAVLPGKQKPAVTWLSWLASGRGCKTRTVPSESIWKAILEKRKAREPLRIECTATAVPLDNLLLNLVLQFHPELWSPKVQRNPSLVAPQALSEGPLEI